MISKSLFFKLCFQNFKRKIWSFVLISVVFFFTIFIPTVILISNKDINDYLAYSLIESDALIFGFKTITNNVFLSIVLIYMAIMLAISGFAYLQKKQSVDFYHSLAVKRVTLYISNVINSLLILIVPYFLISMLSAIILSFEMRDMSVYIIALKAFLANTILFTYAYFTMVLAVMITGSYFVNILMGISLYTYIPMFIGILYVYSSFFYKTLYVNNIYLEDVIAKTSSLILMFDFVKISGVNKYAYAGVAAILLFILNMYLYKNRKSEKAGTAIVFEVLKFPVKLLLTVAISLGVGILFYAILSEDFLWLIIFSILALIISHCVIEIIYNSDFKKLFSNKRHLFISALVVAIIISIFKFDLFKVDSFKNDNITSMKIKSDFLEDNIWNFSYEFVLRGNKISKENTRELYDIVKLNMEINDEDTIKEFIKQIDMAHNTYQAKNKVYNKETYDEDKEYSINLEIGYKLKSGRNKYRKYTVYVEDVKDILNKIYLDANYKKAVYPILEKDSKDIVSIDYISYYEKDNKHLKLDNKELVEAYKKDLLNLSIFDREKYNLVGVIRFNDSMAEKSFNMIRTEDYSFKYDDIGYYPIYEKFSETINLLKKSGVNVFEIPNIGNVHSASIYEDTYYEKVITEDKELLKEVLEKGIITNYLPYDIVAYRTYYDYNIPTVNINILNEGDSEDNLKTLTFSFSPNNLPKGIEIYEE